MANIKILIVEDEFLVAQGIEETLKHLGYEIIANVDSGKDAIKCVENVEPDIIIMDIKLVGSMDGIDTAAIIKLNFNPIIIFLTDLDDKRTLERAAKIKPAAYLLKPFNERQLIASIEHALFNISNNLIVEPTDQSEIKKSQYVLNSCLFIRKEQENLFRKVSLDDVIFIRAKGAYSEIHTSQGEVFLNCISMNHVHEKLPNDIFIQVHRSYVVNIKLVDGIKNSSLIIGEYVINIGDSYRKEALKYFPLLK